MLKYIKTNYGNLRLVNKFYSSLINIELKKKDKIIYSTEKEPSYKKLKEIVKLYIELFNDEDFIEKILYIKVISMQEEIKRSEINIFRLALKYSKEIKKKYENSFSYETDYQAVSVFNNHNDSEFYHWLIKNFKENKDIEIYERYLNITSFELFKDAFQARDPSGSHISQNI